MATATTEIAETRIPGPHGEIRVRTYVPTDPTGVGIVWIHGGGFQVNDIDVPEAHWVAQELAARGVTVVSPDYRLARDGVHFPVLTDECRTAWEWALVDGALAHVDEWHIGGGSAGGNLAAAVSMELRDRGAEVRPVSNVLIYPAMHSPFPDPRPELARKVSLLPEEERPSAEASRQINLNYVGDPDLLQHPLAFPGHGELDGMPPSLIVNSDLDAIRASGERYGAQLIEAGVDTVVIREVGAEHGHLNFPDRPDAQRTVARIAAWLSGTPLRGGTHDDPV